MHSRRHPHLVWAGQQSWPVKLSIFFVKKGWGLGRAGSWRQASHRVPPPQPTLHRGKAEWDESRTSLNLRDLGWLTVVLSALLSAQDPDSPSPPP